MRNSFYIVIFILFFNVLAYPCTTAVISGKATDDGRPLLLKNRDSDVLQNKLVFFSEGKFNFIGLVNSTDKENKEVWCGFNSVGFAIMNSASYNLKRSDTTKLSDREGVIMKLALESCATLNDFEQMLKELPKPLGVEANFGVIDAAGGAAYYETDNFNYKKFDVNDPAIAPNGYLIRTNYSFSGEDNKGYGYIRYSTAADLLSSQYNNDKISFEFLINDVPRCLVHSFTQTDLSKSLPESENAKDFVFFRDYIPRYSTSAAIVVQGVQVEETPSLTTMWTILGFPLTSVIIPVWLLDDGILPKTLQAGDSGNAPFCDLALKLKAEVFPLQNDAKENYLNIAALMNKENKGLRQRLVPFEEQIIKEAKSKLNLWRRNGLVYDEVKKFYAWIDNTVFNKIRLELGIE